MNTKFWLLSLIICFGGRLGNGGGYFIIYLITDTTIPPRIVYSSYVNAMWPICVNEEIATSKWCPIPSSRSLPARRGPSIFPGSRTRALPMYLSFAFIILHPRLFASSAVLHIILASRFTQRAPLPPSSPLLISSSRDRKLKWAEEGVLIAQGRNIFMKSRWLSKHYKRDNIWISQFIGNFSASVNACKN